jgi:sugar phosphate isomerase/epimerase
MQLAYNTNGLANHSLLDAIELLASIGYSGVSITLDHGVLNPFNKQLNAHLGDVAQALKVNHLCCVIETGARFLLDPHHKHEPTLISPDSSARARRIDFLNRAINIAARLNADCVSLWSGVLHDGAGEAEGFSRLVESLPTVLEEAERRKVAVAFEPEPGMLIDTVDRYDELLNRLVDRGVDVSRLGLTIDVGHLHCQGELPIAEKIRESKNHLKNVHIEDMRAGVHEHLKFGEGEIDFPPVIAALAEIRYDGLLSVELSRHSHEGPQAARHAYNFLRPLIQAAAGA